MVNKSGPANGVFSGSPHQPLRDAPCHCLADFFRQELQKHYACLERQREYYSDAAISQAEQALERLMEQIEQLCQRDDGCRRLADLLRKLETVTRLSAWIEPHQLH
jgi:nitrate/nitrite-specific signal transduction histidine kinase